MASYFKKNNASQIAIILAALVIPGAIWAEQHIEHTWQERLIAPESAQTINLHTPSTYTGTFLPPEINKPTRLTKQESPIIVRGTTTITKNGSLTIDPGITMMMHEYATIIIEGTLLSEGQEKEPVRFTTNEANETNQIWSGLLFMPGSSGTLEHTTIAFASPAITCENNASVSIQKSEIKHGNVGIFTKSPACQIENSVIHAVKQGILGLGLSSIPQINTTIDATEFSTRLLPEHP